MEQKQLHKKMSVIMFVLAAVMIAVNTATVIMYDKIYVYGLSALVAFLGVGIYMHNKARTL